MKLTQQKKTRCGQMVFFLVSWHKSWFGAVTAEVHRKTREVKSVSYLEIKEKIVRKLLEEVPTSSSNM